MGELLKRVAAEAITDKLKRQLRRVGSAILTNREVSQCTRGCVEDTVHANETIEQACCVY